MALIATPLDGGMAVDRPLKFRLSACGLAIYNGLKSFFDEYQPQVLNREANVHEKDLTLNYELIKEVMMAMSGSLPNGIPPLKDFEAAFVYTTAAHNLHVELHQVRGGKRRMRDWAHREATRLRAALQHLHRLTAKTSVSRNPMVKVLKKLYVHFRSKGSDVGDLGHDALEDIENDQGEELVIENMDDEPIIISIKDLPSPGEGIAMKAIRDCYRGHQGQA
ncbi:unnamed protein product [Durusdinium trenchii]|uniref:Uncharacterized protein n=1 Tax=Durusdinium trenchii TaxID=1381693 RepID=A0ABP0SPM8_9DINO